MASNLDFARELAAAADRDLLVLRKLAPDRDVAIEKLGFECRQAVEKYLKAILAACAYNAIAFWRNRYIVANRWTILTRLNAEAILRSEKQLS